MKTDSSFTSQPSKSPDSTNDNSVVATSASSCSTAAASKGVKRGPTMKRRDHTFRISKFSLILPFLINVKLEARLIGRRRGGD